MPTERRTIPTSAAYAPEDDILTIRGLRLPEPDTSAQAAQFIISVTPAELQSPAVTLRRKRITSGQAVIRAIRVHGIPIAHRREHMYGMDTTTLCVQGVLPLMSTSGVQCTAERLQSNGRVRIKGEKAYV